MNDHIKNDATPDGLRTPPRNDLPELISVDSQWEELAPTASALSCGHTFIHGYNTRNGLHITVPIGSCDTWWHRPCAEAKARTTLLMISRMVERAAVDDEARFFFGSCRTAELAGNNRLGDRRHRVEKRIGRPVEYITIHRKAHPDSAGGMAIILASASLGGRNAPSEFVPAPDPLVVAVAALSLPGVARVNHSRWRVEEHEDEESDNVIFGAAGMAFAIRVKERAARKVEDKYGVSILPMAGATADGHLTYGEYLQLFFESWDEERRISSGARHDHERSSTAGDPTDRLRAEPRVHLLPEYEKNESSPLLGRGNEGDLSVS